MLMNSKGFSMVEMLVALIILAISILAMASLMATTTQNNSFGSHMTEAATFGQDVLEQLRAGSWGNIATGLDTRTGATGMVYNRAWNVASNPADTMRTITITVSWTDLTNHSVTFTSVISQ